MTATVHDGDPTVTVNGVTYAYVMGDGHAPWDPEWNYWGPAYVWVAVCDPEYVAPLHVSHACDAAYELDLEVEAAECAAGWDPNP